MYGVELDSISGRIAKQLYQKNNISVQGFETAQYPDSFFDCVIGNVPFGSYKVADRKYDRHNFMIHDYFIAKSLDLVRPGGVVAVVTSSGTLTYLEPSVCRIMLSERMQGQMWCQIFCFSRKEIVHLWNSRNGYSLIQHRKDIG